MHEHNGAVLVIPKIIAKVDLVPIVGFMSVFKSYLKQNQVPTENNRKSKQVLTPMLEQYHLNKSLWQRHLCRST